jgi:hypothetical protein
VKHARYIRETLYVHLDELNVKFSFARYSHELVISVFVITEFYCIFKLFYCVDVMAGLTDK